MKRLMIAAVGLAFAGGLLGGHSLSVRAQPVASITMPDPGDTERTVDLYAGCNIVSLTFPDGTAPQRVVDAVEPAGVLKSMWRYDAVLSKWDAFSPAAAAASDLKTVNFLDAVWLCVAGASVVQPTSTSVPPSVPTSTPTPSPPSAGTPVPSAAPTNTPVPPSPTATPVPSAAPTNTPVPPSPTAPPVPPSPNPTPGELVIETCIDGTFTGWDGYTAYQLCNGQVWMQSSYSYMYYYAYRPDATIACDEGGCPRYRHWSSVARPEGAN